MIDDYSEHEWVTDFTEFEAVLVCKNELGAWDQNVCLRAFQTFNWEDATTPGSDVTFKHEATGALVRHDGGLVAIETLHNELHESLHDLFRVLHALGWREAEVYHPMESMAMLLRDFGKAIPAQLEFDIRPAASLSNIAKIAEANALIERGQSILNARPGNMTSNEIMDELTLEDDEPIQVQSAVQENRPFPTLPSNSGGAFEGFALEDDDAVGNAPNPPVETPMPAIASPVMVAVPAMDGPVAVPPAMPAPEWVAQKQDTSRFDEVAHLAIENERLRDELKSAHKQYLESIDTQVELRMVAVHAQQDEYLSEITSLREELDSANAREEAAGQKAISDGVIRESLMDELERLRKQNEEYEENAINSTKGEGEAMNIEVVQVGASAFCFGSPVSPVSDDLIESLKVAYKTEDVMHLHLGAIDHKIHWNVLGDISESFPWEAEKLACAMGFSGGNSALIASLLMDLKKEYTQPQLRDLLVVCESSGFDMKVKVDKILDESHSPNVKFLFSRLLSDDLRKVLDDIILRLSPLLLCHKGQSFIDIRSDEEEFESFTVRGLLESPVPQIFVVHVDALDGPFVKFISDLLREVVLGYGTTARYEFKAEIADVDMAEIQALPVESMANESEKALSKMQALMGEFVRQMQQLSVGGNG